MKVESKPISEINVGTRRREDFGDIEGLAASIAKYGLFHPIIVDGENNLVAGERRLVACTSLGWSEIPVRLYSELSEDERREIELEENLQRKDLTPYEQSKQLVELAETAAKVIETNEIEFRPTMGQKSESTSSPIPSTSKGRPTQTTSERKVAERINVPRSTIQRAKEHVKAVESHPELKDAPQATAISTAKKLDSNKKSHIKPVPIPKPSKRSPLFEVQNFIDEVRRKGGAVAFAARMTEQEKFSLRDEIDNCKQELENMSLKT